MPVCTAAIVEAVSNSYSIRILLQDTGLFGGVKVMLLHADTLARLGHDVTVVSTAPTPDWCQLGVEFLQVDDLSCPSLPKVDIVVATYWETIEPAMLNRCNEVVHFCQGFEWDFSYNQPIRGTILDAYRSPIPAFVVSPHLGQRLDQDFFRPSRLVLQPLERFWRPPLLERLRRVPKGPPFRILVPGPWEGDWKGVKTALHAIKEIRALPEGPEIRLIRLSQFPLGPEEESLLKPDEYHSHLTPTDVAALVCGCDLMLAPSWEQEGFGLPVLEAFACGVPVVASDVSSFRGFASQAAILVPPDDASAFAEASRMVLKDFAQWQRMRRAGFSIARHYDQAKVTRSLEKAVDWVGSGLWRREATDAQTSDRDLEKR
ncbi:MAG: hypothetical protein DRJ65_10350 [Acidobacteria bacterium]|nr:MAG: hypothetical protein DRJ65_10350 [Acidobacteriota bacterium]